MKERLFQFMQGRYGVDQLGRRIIKKKKIKCIINMFVVNIVIGILAYLLWFIVIFRMLSKNIYIRNQENEKFLNYIKPITTYIKLKNMNKQDSMHKHFSCPCCKQIVRVPKGRGKIVITCPSCQNKFEKRS